MRVPGLSATVLIFALAVSSVRAEERAGESPLRATLRAAAADLLWREGGIPAGEIDGWLRNRLEEFDLHKDGAAVFSAAQDDKGYIEYLESRGVRPGENTASDICGYLRLKGSVPADQMAWLDMISTEGRSWRPAWVHYLEVKKLRPDAFEPAVFMLASKDPRTGPEFRQLVEAAKEAWRTAERRDEKAMCLFYLSGQLSRSEGAEEAREAARRWLDDLEEERPDGLMPAFVRFNLALAEGDVRDAARYASVLGETVPAFHSLEALFLEVAGRKEEARAAPEEPDLELEPDDEVRLFTRADLAAPGNLESPGSGPPSEPPPIGDARAIHEKLLREQDRSWKRELGLWLRYQLNHYELDRRTWKTVETVCADDEDLLALVAERGRNLDATGEERIAKALRESPEAPADVAAWFELLTVTDRHWSGKYTRYEELRRLRPDDYVPNLWMLISKDPETPAEREEWFGVVKAAWETAEVRGQRAMVAMAIPAYLLRMSKDPAARTTIDRVEAWLSGMGDRQMAPEVLDHTRMYVDIAQGEWAEAAGRARRLGEKKPEFQGMEPLLLLVGGRLEEAKERLEELSQEPDLDERTRELVEDLLADLERGKADTGETEETGDKE